MLTSLALPELKLPSEHRDALNAVDLRLYFGNHGFSDVIEGHGMAETRLEDIDYAGLESLIPGLNAERGDIIAREAMGYENDWELYGVIDTFLGWHMKGSPYITPDIETALRIPQADLVAENREKKTRFFDALAHLRAFQLISPIEYAALSGAALGVPCHYADITGPEERDFWKSIDKIAAEHPKVMNSYFAWIGERRGEAWQDSRDYDPR